MAKQDNVALFEESSQGSVGAITAIVFVISIILLFGGMILSSYAFGAESLHVEIFAVGLAASVLGMMIPFTLLPALRK